MLLLLMLVLLLCSVQFSSVPSCAVRPIGDVGVVVVVVICALLRLLALVLVGSKTNFLSAICTAILDMEIESTLPKLQQPTFKSAEVPTCHAIQHAKQHNI